MIPGANSRSIQLFFIGLFIANTIFAQNSVLVNFGSNTCNTSSIPNFSLIKSPMTGAPVMLANCDLSAQTADFYNVFIAYNPKNNKIYVADIRNGLQTKIWLLDVGLPLNLSCPISIPVTPTYAYSYISNNFEFDNNGDLWSFSNYNRTTGQCRMDKFDVNTGNVINTRILQFPFGKFPTTIQSGDLAILPNGRMFASLGSGICNLYEIYDYSSTTGSASATYLKTLPKDCYGIAFLNGTLELTGSNFNGNCYYYNYNIVSEVLSAEQTFQNGQLPIDNTSISPAIGCTKQLVNAAKVNSNTADITYEIFASNLGNVVLNNVMLIDNLAAVFGAGNISNVSTSFLPGSNAAGLTLNAAYNGTSITNILNPSQNLPNKILLNKNSYIRVLVNCRVTNLNAATIYLNSAIASGDIGSANLLSLVPVADSSNNGESSVVDPNKNGNAGDIGENVPTPFVFTTLPVQFIAFNAVLINKNTTSLNWTIATPVANAAFFEIEYSNDAINWKSIGSFYINDQNQQQYKFKHLNIPIASLYYRVKQTDKDGSFIYSKTVLLINKLNETKYIIYPNPAGDIIQITGFGFAGNNFTVAILDATGRRLIDKKIASNNFILAVNHLPNGTYLLQIVSQQEIFTKKIMVKH